MIPTQKCRWYQFSLRRLMVVTTIVCVVLARVAFLRECAEFHDREAMKYVRTMGPRRVYRSMTLDELETLVNWEVHRASADRYRRAMYRPWTIVDETSSYRRPEEN